MLAPPTDAVEQGPHGGDAGADGGDRELVAGPDGKIDVFPAGVEKGEFEEFGEADDADDADAVLISIRIIGTGEGLLTAHRARTC